MNYLIHFFPFLFIFISYCYILCATQSVTRYKDDKTFFCSLTKIVQNFAINSTSFDFAKFDIPNPNYQKLYGLLTNGTNKLNEPLESNIRYGGNRIILYLNSNIKNFRFFIICDNPISLTYYYQGINASNLDLYDNTHFTLNSTLNKNITINYKSELENLSSNYIIVTISFPSIDLTTKINAKWKENQEVEVNELFPHTKNIILSSNTIPNYSKGETLYFSFETKKEIETKISSRIVNIIDNKGITNIEMYHEYYTIIGGNININQECFNIDNTIYDSSSKNLMISAYSFYGINITLYNDQEIIETKIITNWNYIIINPQITKSICYFPISSNSLSGVFFQLIDYNTLDKNQNQIFFSN